MSTNYPDRLGTLWGHSESPQGQGKEDGNLAHPYLSGGERQPEGDTVTISREQGARVWSQPGEVQVALSRVAARRWGQLGHVGAWVLAICAGPQQGTLEVTQHPTGPTQAWAHRAPPSCPHPTLGPQGP